MVALNAKKSRYSADAFEKAAGVSGVAGKYNYPEEMGRDGVQNQIYALQSLSHDRSLQEQYLGRYGETVGKPYLSFQNWNTLDETSPLKGGFRNFLANERTRFVRELYEPLMELNPEVAERIDTKGKPEDMLHVVHGMVSGFNIDDIAFFLGEEKHELRNPPANADQETKERSRQYLELRNDVVSRSAPIHWVPSPKTLEHIWEQVKDRPQVDLDDSDVVLVAESDSLNRNI